ncbi:hypothetical protein AHAS_Ahas10G0205500 [Arachis hypogaea]
MRVRYQSVTACAVLVLVAVVVEIAELCICANSTTLLHPQCLERERQALVKFKASLTDSSNLLSSWHGHDCCQWEGIGCDNVTGHVVMLDLATPYVKWSRSVPQIEYDMAEDSEDELVSSEYDYHFSDQYLVATNVNSSLLELEYLSHLDLSGNFFYPSPIPMFIGSMQRLRYLSLSRAYLSGRIPSNLGNLTNLHFLDLSDNEFSRDSNINWISQLPLLEHLDMSSIYYGLQVDIVNVTISAPNLQILSLAHNRLNVSNLDAFQNATSIEFLDLSWNNFDSLPSCLNLSNNHLIGKIPNKIGDMRSLESFDVSSNQLSGTIPSSMPALTSLSHLNLSYNNFSGPIPTEYQFSTYKSSSYAGNPYLCGYPLPNKCGYLHEDHGSSEFEDGDSNLDKLEKWLFYLVIAIGFATGFWGVIGTLWFKKTWRHAYFRWVEDLADTIYVTTAIRMAKLKKWMMKRNRVVA